MINWSDYPNFTPGEFVCKETGEFGIRPQFLRKLQALRTEYGRPMAVTSGYRSPKHSIEEAKTVPGPHSTGLAADIRVGPGEDVHELVRLAYLHGFNGIGVSQRAGRPRFVHLDIVDRKAVWSY